MADAPSDFDTFNPFGGLSGAPIVTGGSKDFDIFAKPYVPPAPAAPAFGGGATSSWSGGPLTLDTLKPLFVAQESSGNYAAVNAETGALGRYQVMPETGAALAKRAGLPWNPMLMRLNTVSGRAYQDQIGAQAIQDSIDAGGGDPQRIFSHYYSGNADAYAKPGNPKTAKYVQDMMARLTGHKGSAVKAEAPVSQGGFEAGDVQGGFQTGSTQGGFQSAPKAADQGGFNTGVMSGLQSGVASAIKAFGSAADFFSASGEAGASMGEVVNPQEHPAGVNHEVSQALQPTVTGMEQRAAVNAPKKPNLAQRVAGGAAGMVPALAAGAANPLAMAGIFAQQSYDETYKEAMDHGLSRDDAVKAASEAAAISGTLGMVPGEAVVGKIGGAIAKRLGIKGAQGAMGQIIQRGVTRAAGNASVMGGMKAGSNVVAKANYDPDRPVMQGVGEAALEGALAGEVIHGTMRGVGKTADVVGDSIRARQAATDPHTAESAMEPMPATDALANYRAGLETDAAPEVATAMAAAEPVKATFEVGDRVRAGETVGEITGLTKSGKSARVEGVDKPVLLSKLEHEQPVDPETGRPVALHGAEDAAKPAEAPTEPAPGLMAHEAAQAADVREPTAAEPLDIAALQQGAEQTHEELTQRLADVGLDRTVALRIVDSLNGPQGSYHEGVMKIALDHPDTLDTMNHEVVHAVRDAITPKEWDALTREVDANPVITASVERRYPNLTAEEKHEEAVADLFKWYAKGVREYPKGAIASAFDRVRDIFRQIGNVLRGRGFHTAESVLRAIDQGRIGGRVTDGRYTASPLLQAAYHGSPHDFDEFSDHAIGTGEGAQAYGYGHYFAGKKEVAEFYREALTRNRDQLDKIGSDHGFSRDASELLSRAFLSKEKFDEWFDHLQNVVDGLLPNDRVRIAAQEIIDRGVDASDVWRKFKSAGKLYKVDIPEEHEFLAWDESMFQQSQHVLDALGKMGFDVPKPGDIERYQKITREMDEMARERDPVTNRMVKEQEWHALARERDRLDNILKQTIGANIYHRLVGTMMENGKGLDYGGRNDRAASEALKDAGIAGITYKDAMSRGSSEGTNNYVVFDPKRVAVKEKFSRPDDTKRLRDQAREMGVDPDSIPALRELQDLNKFAASFGEEVKVRAEAMRQLHNEVIPKLRDAGKLPFDVGTRFTTPKSRELGTPPWKVVGYYLDSKDLQKYGYRVEREIDHGPLTPDDIKEGLTEQDVGIQTERAQMLVHDPKGDASPYRDKDWDRAKEVASWQRLGGLSAVKFSLPDAIHDIAPHMDHPEVFETPDKELYVRTPPGYVHDEKMIAALDEFGARPTNTYPRKGDRVLSKDEVNALRRDGGYQGGSAAPLEGAPTPEGATGPDRSLNAAAHEYARSVGLDLKRQAEYVAVDPERASRIAAAYEAMEHNPHDPVVHEAYQNLIRQTETQYRALEKAGYKFWLFDENNDPYAGNPMNAMRDLRANKSMGVFATEAGFGSKATDLDVSENPLLADTGIKWPYGSPDGPLKRVTANDLFRAVHDAFGHGIEGANFRARGEENAWQAHARLFTGSALGALTSETRGQNSWLNYGPHGEANRTAKTEDTVFADQKTGLMPEWTWREGRAGDMETTHGQAAAGHAGERDRVSGLGSPQGDGRPAEAHERPPVQEDGSVKLDHWTAAPGLTRTDPAEWGRSGRFLPMEERSRKGEAPGRTYFGIASGEPGGYVVEKFPGSKRERVEAKLPLDQLYDMAADPDGLKAKGAALPRNEQGRFLYNGKWIRSSSLYENLIKDAGYKGYWIKDASLGLTAAVYEPVDVSKPKFSQPDDKTETPEFKRWFGDSKVADATGKPLVVYHGTTANVGGTMDAKRGAWFSETPNLANEYASNDGGNVTPAYLRVERPIEFVHAEQRKTIGEVISTALSNAPETADLSAARQTVDRLRETHGGEVRSLFDFWRSDPDVMQLFRDLGYDGVRVFEKGDRKNATWAALSPEQIKSLNNRGTFDPNDPRIRYSNPDEQRRAEGPVSRVITGILGRGADAVGAKLGRAATKALPDPATELLHEVQMGLSPMGAGSQRAQASAKDFANAQRLAAYQWGKVGEWITKNFDRDQRQKMWEAADEHGVMLRRGEAPDIGQGLNRLNERERAAVEELQRRADDSFATAQALGMVTGEGLESYVPRMIIRMTATGGPQLVTKDVAKPKDGKGGNLSTTTGQLRQRKHETVEETEAAAKAKFGEDVNVVRDIGTLALATQKLDQAIAGRTLVDKIKQVGKETGEALVVDGKPAEGEFFTVPNHPALQTWAPKLVKNEYGKWEPMVDQNGEMQFEAKPLYIAKEFEGPLRAVLTTPTSGITKALMNLKGKMMSVIMYSPLMHNAVIWGKAIPADPVGVMSLMAYVRGAAARKDPATMSEAIAAGMDPIGHRFFNQDIKGIAAGEGQNLMAGQSWTAQLISAVPGLFSKEAGLKTKEAIDKLGDFWHNTMLWNRIGDLQAGLYIHTRDDLIKKGIDPQTAQRYAAHFANRYAGALPMEGLSKAARTTANLVLFSRSFTLGNIAAYKDIMAGLPSDVRAQIMRDAGPRTLETVQGKARMKAMGMLVLDIGLAMIGVSLAAHMVSWLTGQTYQAPGANEDDKKDRFLLHYEKGGTAVYGRLPTGKVAEDLVHWVESPIKTLKAKLSPYGRLAYALAANDKGFGQKLYDPYDETPTGMAKNLGRVVWEFISGIAPEGQLEAAKEMAEGTPNQKTAAMQAFLPLVGITVSKGAPGGPAMGDIYRMKEEQQFLLNEARPEINAAIKRGDIAGARETMKELGVAPSLQAYMIRVAQNPSLRLNGKQIRNFMQAASPEEKAAFQADMQAAAARRSGQ